MAHRKKKVAVPYVTRMESSSRKRSWEVPLFVVGVGSVLGFSILRDATADPMLRNRYGYDEASCRCDYGPQCQRDDNQWVGPWYAQEEKDREGDDPGRGACRSGGTSSTWIRGAGQGQDGYRTPGMVESGHRGGFGSTGRGVRAAS